MLQTRIRQLPVLNKLNHQKLLSVTRIHMSDSDLGLVYLGPAPMSLSSLSRAHAPAPLTPPQVPEDERVDYEESKPAAPDPSSEARPLTASEA
eukprot:1867924-Pleurochrysis_carterae.AAC.1